MRGHGIYISAMTLRHDTAFSKMHGLGNDFMVIDGRREAVDMSQRLARALADRRRGVGFDQLVLVSEDGAADFALTFFNADGSMSGTCGNATRCVARAEMDRTGKDRLAIRTQGGLLQAEDAGGGLTRVNMGLPRLDWEGVPLAEDMDTLELPIEGAPVATGMGNPHCTFFVEDAETLALDRFGPRYETHPLFPERANVEVVQILSSSRLRLRVWERGTGPTLASGSCASAAVVAATRRGLTEGAVEVVMDGGTLQVDWRADGVWVTGPAVHVYDGVLTQAFLQAAQA